MKNINHIYAQVPAGYYYESLKTNYLQRFWHTQRFIHIQQLLKGREGKLLDIGCADGVFTNEMSKVLQKGSIITAVDIYTPSIQFAQKKFKHITFKTAPAEKLPFKTNSFDIVTCLEMLEHVQDPAMVMKEIKRVLKKGGTAIILLPQETKLFQIIWWIWTKFKGKVWNHAHFQHFFFDAMPAFFERLGFTITMKKTFLWNMLMIFELEKR